MPNDQQVSHQIEDALVARNPRGMAQVQPVLTAGYCLRAAQVLQNCVKHKPGATVLIGTGFPVVGTFETDGPVGAIALYDTLEWLGAVPIIVCGQPLVGALSERYRTHEIRVGLYADVDADTIALLRTLIPKLLFLSNAQARLKMVGITTCVGKVLVSEQRVLMAL